MALKKGVTTSRRIRILEQVLTSGFTSIRDLASIFHERQDTVKRDVMFWASQYPLLHLTEENEVIALPYCPNDDSFLRRLSVNVAEKLKIAKYVVDEIIQPHDSVCFCGATSSFFVVKEVAYRGFHSLTVFVNNLYFLNLLHRVVSDLHLISGLLQRDRALTTPTDNSDAEFARYGVSKSFLGFDGIAYPDGIFASPQWTPLFRSILRNTKDKVYLIGDHTKVGKMPRRKVIGFDELEQLTSDYLVITTKPEEGGEQEARLTQQFNEAVEKFPDGKIKVL